MAFEPYSSAPDGNAAAMPVRIVGTDATGAMPNVPNRPSSKIGRVQKIITVDNQNVGQTLYTVTVGKILYVESVLVSGYNTGTPARLRIKDNTTVLIPIHATGTGLGVLSGAVPLGAVIMHFPDPLPFLSSVVIDVPTGSLVYSALIIGYEE